MRGGLGGACISSAPCFSADFRLSMNGYSSLRPSPEIQTFSAASVEKLIAEVSSAIADSELAWLFGNCLPNTLIRLSRTIRETFPIRSSSPVIYLPCGLEIRRLRIWPFLPLAKEDDALRVLLEGMLRRQAQSVRLDPYANAFYREPVFGEWRDDQTEMRPGVHERKWELDSLAYFVRFSHGYWEATGDLGSLR